MDVPHNVFEVEVLEQVLSPTSELQQAWLKHSFSQYAG